MGDVHTLAFFLAGKYSLLGSLVCLVPGDDISQAPAGLARVGPCESERRLLCIEGPLRLRLGARPLSACGCHC